MQFGVHNPSWVYGPDPSKAFERLKASLFAQYNA
jgi:hypothetical protein